MGHNKKIRMWSMAAAAALIASPANAQLALTPGDVNGDGIVNGLDIAMVASHWGDGYGPGDANSDGIVNGLDIAAIASHWLQTGPTQAQVIASLPAPPASAYTSGYNAIGLQQIGLTQSVAAAGNYGDGVTIGIVDTGILATDPSFANRISTQSTCVSSLYGVGCLANHETNGIYEDAGSGYHGSIIAGVAAGANPLQIGIAPKATIDVVKNEDINADAGIRVAADSGAKVINLSIPGALEDVDAINYAASKGATIVIAAGNNGFPYFDFPGADNAHFMYQGRSYSFYAGAEYGFTQQALSHIIVVGAVNRANQIESWSNIPGSDFIGTTGTQSFAHVNGNGSYTPIDLSQYGCPANGAACIPLPMPIMTLNNSTGPTASLQSIWLMAPGEIPNEGSGTSFAAPSVAGAIALLESRWPILVQNGTAPQVLFASATDLGAPGVDDVYGNGLLNLQAAFQPIGGVNVLTANGSTVSVNQLVSSIQAGGPMGAMQALQAALTNYTVFDSFSRDFKENLAYLINYRPSPQSLAQTATAPQARVSSVHLADGSSLSFGSQNATDDSVDKPMGHAADENWMVSFTDGNGSTVSAGQGFPASASFAEAMWGSNNAAANQSSSLGVANAVASLAEGGMFTAVGTNIGKDTRLAFGWSETKASDPLAGNDWIQPNANAFNAGFITKITDGWTGGLSMSMLTEQSGLLGSVYNQSGPISFGSKNQTMSMGVSSGFALGDKTDLLIEAAVARTNGSNNTASLISSVSPLYARSYGASISERDMLDDGDRFELTVKAPLRVYSGSASLTVDSVDANGNPVIGSQNIGLKPNGNELDLGMAYHALVHESFEWNASLTARLDADNVAGNTDVIGLLGATYRF